MDESSERLEDTGDEEGCGEECYEGPEVEELREVDCCDVVGFVALFVLVMFGVQKVDLPRTTPPFQTTKAAKETRRAM